MNDFEPASELKKRFYVLGHFYTLEAGSCKYPCRSVLQISSMRTLEVLTPDLIFVMMNPGKSRPLDSDYVPREYTPNEIIEGQRHRDLIPTQPDPTQYQLMRLMCLLGLNVIHVVNLCDLRNGNANGLKEDLLRARQSDPSESFSICHPARLNELAESLRSLQSIPFFAWGENALLEKNADRMLQAFPSHRGLPRRTPWFRHPSPMLKTKKLEWLKLATAQIGRSRNIPTRASKSFPTKKPTQYGVGFFVFGGGAV